MLKNIAKATVTVIAIDIAMSVILNKVLGKRSLKVKSFVAHEIQAGDTMETIVLDHNPLLSETPSALVDISEKMFLLNPHAKKLLPGVFVQVPIFKI